MLTVSSIAGTTGDDFKPNGKVTGRIYANFNRGVSDATSDEAAFAVERAYFGYQYHISEEFFAKVLLDIGSPNDVSGFSKLRRYAYFANAYLRWKKNDVTIDMGLIPLYQFKLSEKYWGHRYVERSLMDMHGFGSKADMGVNITYKANHWLTVNGSYINGEGYKNLQSDKYFKTAVGATVTLPVGFVFRGYGDVLGSETVSEKTLSAFLGWKYKDKLVLGAEYDYKYDEKNIEGQDRWGYSVFGSYNIDEQWQLFARYDKVRSEVVSGESLPWDLADDGTMVITGIQYRPEKKISFALLYRDWKPWATNQAYEGMIFLNLGLDF